MATVGLGGLVSLVAGIPIVAYVLGPVIKQPADEWRNLTLRTGSGAAAPPVYVDTIPLGLTRQVIYENLDPLPWAGATANGFAWLRRTGAREFVAFSPICTHLGCPVNWVQAPEIFLCPCHGSVYDSNGAVVGGPAPRPLFRLPIRVAGNRVQIKAEPLPLVHD